MLPLYQMQKFQLIPKIYLREDGQNKFLCKKINIFEKTIDNNKKTNRI